MKTEKKRKWKNPIKNKKETKKPDGKAKKRGKPKKTMKKQRNPKRKNGKETKKKNPRKKGTEPSVSNPPPPVDWCSSVWRPNDPTTGPPLTGPKADHQLQTK